MGNNFKLKWVVLCLTVSTIGCAALSPNENVTAENVLTLGNETTEYDLSLYLFHQNLGTENGQSSYTLSYFDKSARKTKAVEFNQFQFVRNGNRIEKTALGLEGIWATYSINDFAIREENPTMDNARSIARFATMGDTYIDNFYANIGVNENCKLEGHFDSFNLSIATGDVKLANDVYEDVIQVYCTSSFVNEDGSRPNFDWKKYYAKGVGLVFLDGDWPNYLGPVYAIARY